MIALLVLFVILFAAFALLKKKLLAFITCGVLFTVFRKNAPNDDDDRDNDKSGSEQQE